MRHVLGIDAGGTKTRALLADESGRVLAAADGSTVDDISGLTHLSCSTVRNYLSDAIGKTRTRNRMEAVRVARSAPGPRR